MSKQGKRKGNPFLLLIEVILIAVILWQLVNIGRYLWDTKTSKSAYDRIETAVKEAQVKSTAQTEKKGATTAPKEDPVDTANRVINLLKGMNKDAVGYIDIEALGIHYPIVQGVDNDEYLFQSMEGEYSIAGTIYMDYANQADFSDRNTVLYGHHMKDGTMFHNLSDLRKESYEGETVEIAITREGGIDRYLVYAVSSVPEDEPYRDAYFPDAAAWQNFLRNTKESTETEFPIDPSRARRVLTLSTCTPNDDGMRIAVHAILQEPSE